MTTAAILAASALSASFFALFSLTRCSINLGILDRPIAVGIIWGLCSGDMPFGLAIAIFYELFWIDLFPVGTYIPPNPLFPMCFVAALAHAFTLTTPAEILIPALLTLPLAAFGAWLEERHRTWRIAGYSELLRQYRKGSPLDATAQTACAISILQLFIATFVVLFMLTLLGLAAYSLIRQRHGNLLLFPDAGWHTLWLIGALGGLLSLRTRHSLIIFIILMFLLTGYSLL